MTILLTASMLPRLLLHACCGVCSSYVPERLMPEFDVTLYFENSNLYPEREFYRRQEAAQFMARRFSLPFIMADYRPGAWFKHVRGLSREPERGARCEKCVAFRLDKTMEFAKQNGFDWVATTLSVSRRKNTDQINRLGSQLAEQYGINFLGRDWKKDNGEVISQARAKQANIYRQNYCGCVYSYLISTGIP